MKKIYLIILFLIPVCHGQSQSWAQPGAVWYYNYFNLFYGNGYYQIQHTGDTVIQNHLCNRLSKSYALITMQGWQQPIPLGDNYVYQDSNVVYCLRNGTFPKLYDFNALQGDTVYFGWDNMEIIPGSCDSLGFYIVDSVGSTVINGINVNFQNIRFYDYFYWGGFVDEKIYDRFGGDFDLFFYRYGCDSGIVVDADIITPLCSYYDSAMGFYSNSHAGVCDSITGIQDQVLSGQQIILLTNPVKDKLALYNFSKEALLPYSIYDATGKVLLKGNLIAGKNFISVNSLSNGIFFFKTNSQKFSFAQKFIKD